MSDRKKDVREEINERVTKMEIRKVSKGVKEKNGLLSSSGIQKQ